MKYPSIHIEGAILSADIVERIAGGDYAGQAPADFGMDGRVRDEIARAWADARALWGMFTRRRSGPSGDDRSGTSRTRTTWILPLMSLLGYELEYTREAPELRGRKYPVSHRAVNRADLPVHVVGFLEDLDSREGRRMSAHSLVQEYLNLADEHLYALVTNGLRLRLLRDASRLIRLSYVEMDLERMMEEELYADFAVLFRLLHATRFASGPGEAASCILERYHQDALENGERIRGGLSLAVERSIVTLADGFLNEPENVQVHDLPAEALHHALLVVVYRILFLLVVEERDLVFADGVDERKRTIYYEHYSVSRLRRLAEIARSEDGRNTDLWTLLRQTFRLFEEDGVGEALGISPLGGDLFGARALGPLAGAVLRNRDLAACMENLNRFHDAQTRQSIRVNYGALNVEEFGSVYEGLLEKDPVASRIDGAWRFSFKAGEARASSGSHYTPEELTHPLIRNSLDHVIAARLAEPDPQAALLSIRICDPACGSGHILLNAARRIGLELARVRTGVEQPAPPDVRRAVRDAIRHCLYGVDKNPHAVELCKVALWLESHDPGEPLGFLDHHIKCGDSVVGVARREDLLEGIPESAFKRQADDDRTAAAMGKRNRAERGSRGQIPLALDELTRDNLESIQRGLHAVDGMAEHTLVQIEEKRVAYENLVSQAEWKRIRELASILVAQSFLPKTEAMADLVTTDADYLRYVAGEGGVAYDLRADTACRLARDGRFFHWFVEFPEVFERGGFDCILGNPPFLGGRKISGTLGDRYLEYLRSTNPPAGAIDLVGFFFRRAFALIRQGGYLGLIATNTIAQGDTREGSLEPITKQGGEIVFAVRSMKWPGLAAVSVSLLAIHKGSSNGRRMLDGSEVDRISPYLDDAAVTGNPYRFRENAERSFQGSIVLGMGFVLEPREAQALIDRDPRNRDVLFPYLNGEDLNSRPDQSPSRWVINFQDWQEEKAREYPDCFRIVEEKVKPERARTDADGKYKLRMPLPVRWWIYADKRPGLYRAIAPIERVLVTAIVSKYLAPAFASAGIVFMHKLCVFPFDRHAHYALLQSSLHESWAWKYCSTLEGRINYAPSDCFETFPFPQCLRGKLGDAPSPDVAGLESAGRAYYEHRQALMHDMQLGLTKTYNLFHDPGVAPGASDLSALDGQLRKSGGTISAVEAAARIQALRDLHVAMDKAVLAAYGWAGLPLGHGFHEVDFLPENDRLRFTVSPAARRELLKRLLELNHRYHAEEEQEAVARPKRGKRRETVEPHPELGL